MNALMNLLSNWKRWPFIRYVDNMTKIENTKLIIVKVVCHWTRQETHMFQALAIIKVVHRVKDCICSQNMIFYMCTVVWWHIVGVQPRLKDNDKRQ